MRRPGLRWRWTWWTGACSRQPTVLHPMRPWPGPLRGKVRQPRFLAAVQAVSTGAPHRWSSMRSPVLEPQIESTRARAAAMQPRVRLVKGRHRSSHRRPLVQPPTAALPVALVRWRFDWGRRPCPPPLHGISLPSPDRLPAQVSGQGRSSEMRRWVRAE